MLTPIQDKRLAQQTRKLAHIQQLSQSARTAWFGLLALLVFVGVTLMGHEDADFFAFGAATQLPVVNVEVDPTAFFIGASILTAALYIHLHLHLFNLWYEIGGMAPMIHDDQEGAPERLSARIYPTTMTSAALLYRNRKRKDGSCHVLPLGWAVELITWLLVWAFGLVILGLLWLRFAPAHNLWISLLIGACFWAALMTGIYGWLIFSARLAARPLPPPGVTRWAGVTFSALCVVVVSYSSSIGLGARVITNANLQEAKITSAPKDWLDYAEWKKEHEDTFRRREGYPKPGPLPLEKQRELEQERPIRWAARLDDIDLKNLEGANLNGANLSGGFLAGAKLVDAQMEAANLTGARMEGANFSKARMQGVNLTHARMERADFSEAQMVGATLREGRLEGASLVNTQMDGASLFRAQMQGADLSSARLATADLSNAQMDGATLSGAQLEGAKLFRARLVGAILFRARLQNVNFFGAEMTGANVFGAWMDGADLSEVRLDGANLSGAQMQGVKLTKTRMEGTDLSAARVRATACNNISAFATSLRFAEFTCPALTQLDLQGFVGNDVTLLPDGMTIPSCVVPSDRLDDALKHIPESDAGRPLDERSRRKEYRDQILCQPGEIPHHTGVWAFEKRHYPEWFQGEARQLGIGIRMPE